MNGLRGTPANEGTDIPCSPGSKADWRVLVFPGGTEVGLEIARSLRFCKGVQLYSTSSDVPNHAPFFYRHHATIPAIDDASWLASLRGVLERWKVNVIYPANPLVIDALMERRHELPPDCLVVMPEHDVWFATRSKRRTYALLQGLLPVPREYKEAGDVDTFPVFVKPDRLYGGQGAQPVQSRAELEALIARDSELLIQALLPGAEYTVDCFTDGRGELRFCAGRQRQRVRMGTSMRAALAPHELQEQFVRYGTLIQSAIAMRGAWFFQLKEDAEGRLILLEVEARIAGTMALNRVRGVNFPFLSLHDRMGGSVELLVDQPGCVLDRALHSRYHCELDYDHVYVDLDDTLLVHGQVNTQLAAYLFQCINRQVRITLISKSLALDKRALLDAHRIGQLFDEVIWLTEQQSKADFIDPTRAIFIDDSFSQRQEVARRHAISTFDPSMVEGLLDERL